MPPHWVSFFPIGCKPIVCSVRGLGDSERGATNFVAVVVVSVILSTGSPAERRELMIAEVFDEQHMRFVTDKHDVLFHMGFDARGQFTYSMDGDRMDSIFGDRETAREFCEGMMRNLVEVEKAVDMCDEST
jgi:hypothetical protein